MPWQEHRGCGLASRLTLAGPLALAGDAVPGRLRAGPAPPVDGGRRCAGLPDIGGPTSSSLPHHQGLSFQGQNPNKSAFYLPSASG